MPLPGVLTARRLDGQPGSGPTRERQNQAAAHGGKREETTGGRTGGTSPVEPSGRRELQSDAAATSSNASVSVSGAARETPSPFL